LPILAATKQAAFAIQIKIADGISVGVVVGVVAAAFDRVDLEEPPEGGDVLACAHFDGGDGRRVLVGALVLSEPAVVEAAVAVVGDLVVGCGGAGVPDGPGGQVDRLAVRVVGA
jgi:hypothetical protein